MPIAAGFFVDWDGNARSTLDPGGGYLCETDPASRYVAINTKGGTLVHEGTFYKAWRTSKRQASRRRWCPAPIPGAGRKTDSE